MTLDWSCCSLALSADILHQICAIMWGKKCIVSWKWQCILVRVEKQRAKNRTKILLLVINCCWSLKQRQQQQQRTGQRTWIKIRKKHLKPECTDIRCESMNIHPSRVTGGWSQMRCGVHPGPQCIAELTYRGTVTHLQAINLTCVSGPWEADREPGGNPCRPLQNVHTTRGTTHIQKYISHQMTDLTYMEWVVMDSKCLCGIYRRKEAN